MTGYQKTIAYLDYLENGMKMRNAGFARVEENNNQKRLEMKVKKIPDKFSGEYEVKTDTGGTIGRISFSRGDGSCSIVWETGGMVPEGKRLTQAKSIYVRLPGRCLLQAVWPSQMEFLAEEEEKISPAVQKMEEESGQDGEMGSLVETNLQETAEKDANKKMDASNREKTDMKAAENTGNQVLAGTEEEMTASAEEAEPEALGHEKRSDSERAAEEEESRKTQEKTDRKQREEEPVCYGDKWEQLSHMYAQIHPFADEREYLSIAPKDFVVLRQEYQKMVHNSFLLHGYYNYRHLILGKIKEKDGWSYYLGVPGNFYNREKMVAEMFGFEAFEGERNPAKAGDFGYFMKKVEI